MTRVAVVGVTDASALADRARAAIGAADVVFGSPRLLAAVGGDARGVPIGQLATALDAIAEAATAGDRVCVLASGDPGFFGIGRALAARGLDVEVHPAPSSVALAFGRLGLPWDDAAVVSAHGRPLAEAAGLAAHRAKVAVLTGPDIPPEAVAAALIDLGATHEHAAVCSRLGFADEEVTVADPAGVAAGHWDPLSVLVLWSGAGIAGHKAVAWGAPVAAYSHRPGMITKPEVRSVVLGLLALPADPAVVWDIGAGSGSVAIECAGLAPWCDVIAVEADAAAAARCRDNARAHGAAIRVVHGSAPGCLDALPDPDRVFIGGGGLAVLDTAAGRLRPGGVCVATFAAMDRAAAAASRLGNLASISVNHGCRLPDGGWRLEGANPVFVVWGP